MSWSKNCFCRSKIRFITTTNSIFISLTEVNDDVGGQTEELKFAKSIDGGSSWTVIVVDATPRVNRQNSLHVLDLDTIFISYFMVSASDDGVLKFAQSRDGGANWTISTVKAGVFAQVYRSELE